MIYTNAHMTLRDYYERICVIKADKITSETCNCCGKPINIEDLKLYTAAHDDYQLRKGLKKSTVLHTIPDIDGNVLIAICNDCIKNHPDLFII